MTAKPFRVITCAEWGARPPRGALAPVTKKPVRALLHHTAGHSVAGASGETYSQAVAYVKSIQNFHMGPQRGWADTGQNFTVTRNGYIFEGRHGSFDRVSRGQMVVSAHCPGQNDQPGVEVEHVDPEAWTPIQHEALVWLFSWICKACAIPATHIYGHRDFFATACPGALYTRLPQFRIDVASALRPKAKPFWQVKVTDSHGMTKVTTQSKRTYVIPLDAHSVEIQRNS